MELPGGISGGLRERLVQMALVAMEKPEIPQILDLFCAVLDRAGTDRQVSDVSSGTEGPEAARGEAPLPPL